MKGRLTKEGRVIKLFISVARHARNCGFHPELPIERVRAEATMAEIEAERILGKKVYQELCDRAFKKPKSKHLNP